MCKGLCILIRVCICVYVHADVCVHVCLRVCVCTCLCMCMSMYMCCVCVCERVCMSVWMCKYVNENAMVQDALFQVGGSVLRIDILHRALVAQWSDQVPLDMGPLDMGSSSGV